MKIDNSERLLELLNFEEGYYYVVQIIRRGKDQNPVETGRRQIKSYYINSKEYLRAIFPEIISLCSEFNARAYINVNRSNYENTALMYNVQLASLLYNKSYKNISTLYESVSSQNTKIDFYIVDVDSKDIVHLNDVISKVKLCRSREDRKLFIFPTLNGYHIITSPFDVQNFQELIDSSNVEVHKNQPTLLCM